MVPLRINRNQRSTKFQLIINMIKYQFPIRMLYKKFGVCFTYKASWFISHIKAGVKNQASGDSVLHFPPEFKTLTLLVE